MSIASVALVVVACFLVACGLLFGVWFVISTLMDYFENKKERHGN